MDYVTLGRTGLRVSVMGLGCGGPSRLGQTAGHSEAESIAVVQRALDLGVTLVDTAYAYGTETIVGKALSGARRSEVVLSTKRGAAQDGRLLSAPEMVAAVESSLQKLQTDQTRTRRKLSCFSPCRLRRELSRTIGGFLIGFRQ